MWENLETRRLLSGSVFQHILAIEGTAQADEITIRLVGNVYTVTENGAVSTFNATKIGTVIVNGREGNDHIKIDDATERLADEVNIPPADEARSFDVQIHGGPGDDYLESGNGNDTLFGDGGNDSIFGGEGDDAIFGGSGRDKLDGSFGDDLISGGTGSDSVIYQNISFPLILSNDGVKNDVMYFQSTNGARQIESTDNIMPDVENIYGGFGDDVIKGNSANNYLAGGPGNDTLNGGGGIDTINGGLGNDDLWGGANEDVVDYSDRTDRLNITLDNAPNDGAHATATHARERDFIHDDIEDVWGGHDADYIVGSTGPNVIQAGGGNDTILGNGGSDVINGGAGDDDITGDVLDADELFGDSGIDTVRNMDQSDVIGGVERAVASGTLESYSDPFWSVTNGWALKRDGGVVQEVDLSAVDPSTVSSLTGKSVSVTGTVRIVELTARLPRPIIDVETIS